MTKTLTVLEVNEIPLEGQQDEDQKLPGKEMRMEDDSGRQIKFIWKNVVLMSALHITSLYALTLIIRCHPYTLFFGFVTAYLGELGVTGGAHRLWTHRSYKAKLPLRIFLMVLNSIALQNSIFDWARDHRAHHKFSETNADPHNAKRGFFFCHVGWLLVKKHPDVARKGKSIPLDDLKNDPVVTFQRRYYIPIAITCCFILPTLIPWYFWGEAFWNALCVNLLRYCTMLNITWTVNSFAHLYGNRPYDRTIFPAENILVAISTIGEGYHNYHHAFPHDYSTSEYGWKFNVTTMFIDLMATIGQVSDRRRMSKNAIEGRKKRTGVHSNLPLATR